MPLESCLGSSSSVSSSGARCRRPCWSGSFPSTSRLKLSSRSRIFVTRSSKSCARARADLDPAPVNVTLFGSFARGDDDASERHRRRRRAPEQDRRRRPRLVGVDGSDGRRTCVDSRATPSIASRSAEGEVAKLVRSRRPLWQAIRREGIMLHGDRWQRSEPGRVPKDARTRGASPRPRRVRYLGKAEEFLAAARREPRSRPFARGDEPLRSTRASARATRSAAHGPGNAPRAAITVKPCAPQSSGARGQGRRRDTHAADAAQEPRRVRTRGRAEGDCEARRRSSRADRRDRSRSSSRRVLAHECAHQSRSTLSRSTGRRRTPRTPDQHERDALDERDEVRPLENHCGASHRGFKSHSLRHVMRRRIGGRGRRVGRLPFVAWAIVLSWMSIQPPTRSDPATL